MEALFDAGRVVRAPIKTRHQKRVPGLGGSMNSSGPAGVTIPRLDFSVGVDPSWTVKSTASNANGGNRCRCRTLRRTNQFVRISADEGSRFGSSGIASFERRAIVFVADGAPGAIGWRSVEAEWTLPLRLD